MSDWIIHERFAQHVTSTGFFGGLLIDPED
jgi:hypothetical protein